MLRTVDVRTLGIAGGSMIRMRDGAVSDVGPRSAHIAGCTYACFSDEALLDGAVVEKIAPWPDDPEYTILRARDGTKIALTTSCAANALGCVPEGAFAAGNGAAARRAFEFLAAGSGTSGDALARAVLDVAAAKLRATIDELIADYGLDRAHLTIVGGGGGAGAIVPYAADAMGLRHRIARDAEVIAPVGVALALVRDVVERTLVAPTPEDIARLRREAIDRVVAAGASPDRVEVAIEIDSQRNRVRAAASGATALAEPVLAQPCDEDGRRAAAAQSLGCGPADVRRVELTSELAGYALGDALAIVDGRGIVRLVLHGASALVTTAGAVEEAAYRAIERSTRFGDVGRALPALHLVRGERIATYDGLASAQQAVALALEELEGCERSEPVALLTLPRRA